jgi:hypothetical protein
MRIIVYSNIKYTPYFIQKLYLKRFSITYDEYLTKDKHK